MDEVDVRAWALDRAIKEAAGGTQWEAIFRLAEKFTRYILSGTYEHPDADATEETHTTTEHTKEAK